MLREINFKQRHYDIENYFMQKRDRRSQESDISRDETITESAANPVSQTITKSESANVFEDAVVSHEMSFADNQVVPSSSNMDTGVTSSKSIQESIQQNEPDQVIFTCFLCLF